MSNNLQSATCPEVNIQKCHSRMHFGCLQNHDLHTDRASRYREKHFDWLLDNPEVSASAKALSGVPFCAI